MDAEEIFMLTAFIVLGLCYLFCFFCFFHDKSDVDIQSQRACLRQGDFKIILVLLAQFPFLLFVYFSISFYLLTSSTFKMFNITVFLPFNFNPNLK